MPLDKNNLSIKDLEKISLFSWTPEEVIIKFAREDAKNYSFLWVDMAYYKSIVKKYNQKKKYLSNWLIERLRYKAIAFNKKNYPTHMDSIDKDLSTELL